MKALIDGDIILYRCGFAAEQRIHHVCRGDKDDPFVEHVLTFDSKKDANDFVEQDNDLFVETEVVPDNIANALHSVKLYVQNIVESTNCDSYLVCLSGSDNYRNDVASTLPYKGNRDPDHKPFHYKNIKEYITRHMPHIVTEGIEADDYMGIHQSDNTIICTIDKDLRMVEGHHYNLTSQVLDYVTPEDGLYNFAKQIITGDSVDNIPGLRGYGNKKAEKLLDENYRADWWDVISSLYMEQYNDPWVIEETCYLLWILRSYDQIKQPPRWSTLF